MYRPSTDRLRRSLTSKSSSALREVSILAELGEPCGRSPGGSPWFWPPCNQRLVARPCPTQTHHRSGECVDRSAALTQVGRSLAPFKTSQGESL